VPPLNRAEILRFAQNDSTSLPANVKDIDQMGSAYETKRGQ